MSSLTETYDKRLRAIAAQLNITTVAPSNINTSTTTQETKASHNHINLHGATNNFVIYILPFFQNIPCIVFIILNPCLQYAVDIYSYIISVYIFCFIICYINSVIYSTKTWYCNDHILNIHVIHIAILFSLMSCTSGFYSLYSFDNNVWYYIMSLVCSLATLIEYFICMFQRHHLYYCKQDGCSEIPKNPICNCSSFSYDDFFLTLAIIFLISWLSYIIVPTTMINSLNNPDRPLQYCNDNYN